ncbi:MAG: MraY family glycosyltransferase [Arhodomonas sp.]|nr:MraY family glycosyltransferase [Arhodomonas sp.]
MAALLALGIVDDARGMRGIIKLGFQVAVVTLVVVWGGVVIERVGALPGIGTVSLGPAAVPFTIFALVGLINAVNMLDGLDGLAGGVVLGGFGWLLLLAGLQGQSLHMAVSGLLLAAVAAFLLLNARLPWRPRAEVFLGDAGSMSLGLALGWRHRWAFPRRRPQVIGPVAYLWVVAVPVIDTLSLMVRRVLRGRHPFSADRDHLHHLFLRAGFTPGEGSYCLVGISLAAGGIGILGGLAGVPDWLLAVALLGVLVGHYVFIRHAWRTLRALRRLNRAYQDAHVNQVAIRRGALVGFYVAVFCAPVSASLSLAGLALVYLATAVEGRAFLADLRRTPLAALALVVAAFVLLRGGVGGAEDHSLWTHLLPLTGLYSIPLGWWLLRLRNHRLWLLGALAAGLLVAFVQDARWGDPAGRRARGSPGLGRECPARSRPGSGAAAAALHHAPRGAAARPGLAGAVRAALGRCAVRAAGDHPGGLVLRYRLDRHGGGYPGARCWGRGLSLWPRRVARPGRRCGAGGRRGVWFLATRGRTGPRAHGGGRAGSGGAALPG